MDIRDIVERMTSILLREIHHLEYENARLKARLCHLLGRDNELQNELDNELNILAAKIEAEENK